MAKIIYRQHDGIEHNCDVMPGLSVMAGAVGNSVPGIDADCGGACACGTCHVYVDDDWFSRTGAMTATEASMLEMTEGVQPSSRLSCQIKVTQDLDGMIIRLPERQF